MKESSKRERRTKRYTVLLTPGEFELLREGAAREFLSLPSYLRQTILQHAVKLGQTIQTRQLSTFERVDESRIKPVKAPSAEATDRASTRGRDA
jgi:hypothetical protein